MTHHAARRIAMLAIPAVSLVLVATAAWPQSPPAPATATRVNVPQKVLGAFQLAYPAAVIQATSQEDLDGAPAFRFDFTDNGQKRVARYRPDGSLIESGEPVTEQQLPGPVAAAMRSHPRAIFGSGLKLTRAGGVRYELKLKGTRKTTMLVKPDGTVISFK